MDNIGMSEREFERQYVEATRRGDAEMQSAPKARAARYDRTAKRLIIDLQNGVTIMIPTRLIQIFQDADDAKIADIEILLEGLYLSWKQLDEDLSVPSLLQGKFGTTKWMAEINSKTETETKPRKKVA